MNTDDSDDVYLKHEKYCKSIIDMADKGMSTWDIASKLKVAESFVSDIIKKGMERHLKAISQMLNVHIIDDIHVTDNIHTTKTIKVKPENPEPKKSLQKKQYICPLCKLTLIQSDFIEYKGHKIRTMKCKKCTGIYYNPEDIAGIVNEPE